MREICGWAQGALGGLWGAFWAIWLLGARGAVGLSGRLLRGRGGTIGVFRTSGAYDGWNTAATSLQGLQEAFR